eukprot:gene10357-58586_t
MFLDEFSAALPYGGGGLSGLETLDLSHNPALGSWQGARALARIAHKVAALRTVKLWHCFDADEDVEATTGGATKGAVGNAMEKLSLSNTGMNAEELDKLKVPYGGGGLAGLKVLDLSDNPGLGPPGSGTPKLLEWLLIATVFRPGLSFTGLTR